MTDQHRDGPSGDFDETSTDVFTGDPTETRFQVETAGEADVDAIPEGDMAPTGIDEASFAVQPQVGEAVPPELRSPAIDPLEPFELADPTDPGFTLADLAEEGDATGGPSSPAESPPSDPERQQPTESPPGAADIFEFPTPADDTDWDRFTDDDYMASSTQDYEGLAAELERSRFDQHEPSAVAAAMPGIDSGVVGLEDVTGEAVYDGEPAPPSLTELGIRIATGLGLLALFFLSLLTPLALGMLAVVVFTLAAFEFYAVLRRTGHAPIAAFGLAGVLGCLVGAWVWGEVAIPIAIIATLIAVALFYGTSAPRNDTLRDASLTLVGMAWIGGFGAFAMPIISSDDYGWLIAAAVVLVAAMDVGQYFSGRTFGRRPLAPVISPRKTVEGWIGGALITLLIGFGLSFFGPFTRMSAMLVAGAAVVIGPLGDLVVSSIKRQIGVKDMGTLLPGHGGILDRIDALLFVVPSAWLIYNATGLIS